MLKSMYIASTGMKVQREKLDVLSGNIANIETTGYKQDKLVSSSFQDMLITRLNDPAIFSIRKEIGINTAGVRVDEVVTDFTAGSIEETGRLSDLALIGSGFFVVGTNDGEKFTRDGGMAVDAEGYLVTAEGDYVLGENGNIQVGSNGFEVSSTGEVSVDGTYIDTLRIVMFDDETALRKSGDNLFINFAGSAMADAEGVTIVQGSLEASNVDMAETMVDMMAVSQAYGTNQSILKMIDGTLEKTVNEVGKV